MVTFQKTEVTRWLSSKKCAYQCSRPRLDPWVEMIPWRRKWQPTTVFMPGEFYGQWNLAGYRFTKESDMSKQQHWFKILNTFPMYIIL